MSKEALAKVPTIEYSILSCQSVRLEDAKAISKLLNSFKQKSSYIDVLRMLKNMSRQQILLTARHSGLIIGIHTVVIEYTAYQSGNFAHIEKLAVDQDYRMFGVGETLYEMAIKLATDYGCSRIVFAAKDEMLNWFLDRGAERQAQNVMYIHLK